MIEVGNKVVCLKDSWNDIDYRHVNPPIKDKIYVVRGMWVSSCGRLGLYLIGSSSIHILTGKEAGWAARNFRKLEDVKMENELARLKKYIPEHVFNFKIKNHE